MGFLARTRIGTQLYLGFGIGILITCLIGAIGLYQMRQINGNVVQFADNWLPSVKALSVLEATANTRPPFFVICRINSTNVVVFPVPGGP